MKTTMTEEEKTNKMVEKFMEAVRLKKEARERMKNGEELKDVLEEHGVKLSKPI